MIRLAPEHISLLKDKLYLFAYNTLFILYKECI